MTDVGIALMVFGIAASTFALVTLACCRSIRLNQQQMERTSGLLDPYLV